MRWSVVRLIAGKELRDLLRDRRTVMLILVLPAVLYPLFGGVALSFAYALKSQPAVVGVVGGDRLPGPGSGLPSLVTGERAADGLDANEDDFGPVVFRPLDGDPAAALREKRADVVLVVAPDFALNLGDTGHKPKLTILHREGDEKAKLAGRRLSGIIRVWEKQLRERRFERAHLPKDFDKVLTVDDPQTDKPKEKRAADELRDTFCRIFPFIVMMWLVAGAIQPAVDMTAGEKERGTMETLLISPAERSEIVAGKFLATTAFSFASMVWNVLWLTAGAVVIERLFDNPIVNFPGVFGCVVLGVPLAMVFSAVGVALGVFAKSTKEGQYYLMPIMLVSMPLAFWSMLPGAELTPGTFWVPVTGPLLLQRRLLTVSGEPIPWEYFGPVLGAQAVWVAAALAFAVRQFHRESVLFRETGPQKRIGLFSRLFRRDAGPVE
ncbi:ABC transporter permease [Fimbriiglobus ruber]|uniref:ABC-type Na+ efflux pump, permease component n=1 Tax=Fimbriiglobus ruber TaxID=1908690 RepID=A0A225D800_9BACT|nr:ABC transporter permease [Fimbriiglobus ruber]OWK37681.1 ABC-type Na+ efflux pump, permease component [Fimbriiglobus ruber]